MTHKLSLDAIVDSITVLLHEAGAAEKWPFLVYSETDPDLTIETDGDFLTAKIKGKAVPFDAEITNRARSIVAAPLFDYK